MSATLGGWCCVPACIRRRERSRARLAPLSLPYLSPNRGKSRRSPSNCVESFLTVRRLYFPRELGFGVRRRGVVINSPGTIRISVGTPHLVGITRVFPAEGFRSPRSLPGAAAAARAADLVERRGGQVHVAHRGAAVGVSGQLPNGPNR